jgi:hypothetical protein
MTKQELSGHNVKVLPGVTFKWGDWTVGRQAQVMTYASSVVPSLVPRIFAKGDTWYAMQTKQPLRNWNWPHAERALEPLWAMPEHLVLGTSERPFDVDWLHGYIVNARPPHAFFDHMPSDPYLRLRYGNANEATHGDPTHANTLSGYCFIDWQFRRQQYLPAHRSVDYGKFMQSVLGWDIGLADMDVVGATWQAEEIMNREPDAWFWCAIHFMRIKARAKSDLLKKVCDERIAFCIWLRQRQRRVA